MNFSKKKIIFASITILLLLLVGFLAFWLFSREHKTSNQTATLSANAKTYGQDKPLLLKSISFNLDYYDPTTNSAGDMVFTHADHDLSGQFHLIFADFGTQDPRSPNDPTKRNVQPTFVLPLGTKVHSIVDGFVANIETLYSGDETIWVTSTGERNAKYIYETEHIINPIVKVGDKVSGGQVIGEVSTHGSEHHPGFGIVEIGILTGKDGQATHICPFAYLDPSIKEDIQKKILAVHKAWQDYLGMQDLYDDAHAVSPGCFITDPVNG